MLKDLGMVFISTIYCVVFYFLVGEAGAQVPIEYKQSLDTTI